MAKRPVSVHPPKADGKNELFLELANLLKLVRNTLEFIGLVMFLYGLYWLITL